MKQNRYLALLRGINVGGNNIIKMVDLKKSFEDIGCTDVITYIQSGNVIFTSTVSSIDTLEQIIQNKLSKQFKYDSCVVVVPERELSQVVTNAPTGFGKKPAKYRYDVIFLKRPATVGEAMKQIVLRDGVDTVTTGKTALYFSRVIAKAGKSYLSKVIQKPIYKSMTIRNWNTTTKLLALMDEK